MKGLSIDRLPLEPLVHAYVEAGVPDPAALAQVPGLGQRFAAILGARDTLVNLGWLDRTPDGVFQTAIVRFYEACVAPPLHADRLLSRARVVRHALTHLLNCPDPLPLKLERCLAADGPYFVAGLGSSFWSALALAMDPLRQPGWTPAVAAGALRLGLLGTRQERPALTCAALLDAVARIRALAPSMTALHCEHFLSLVARMEGRRLWSGAAPAPDLALIVREERARESLRARLKQRGQALADAQALLEVGLGSRDGKVIGTALAAADPDGSASAPLDWGKHGEELTLWVGRLWEAEDPWPILDSFWEADPISGAGLWLPPAVLHLRDPQRFPPWNDAARAGYSCLDDAAGAGSPSERYRLYCEGVAWLRRQHCLHPLEVPAVLAALAPERRQERAGPASRRFGGFCADTFRFLHELEENNNRQWMETQRPRYHFALRQPLVELCQALTERYVDPVLRGQHGWDVTTEARDGLALTRLTKNDYGRSRPYNTTLWITFCGRDEQGKRRPTQFFVRVDASGVRFGLRLGAGTGPARRRLRQRLLARADALSESLRQRGAFERCQLYNGEDCVADFHRWLAGSELSVARCLPPDAPLLGEDELAGEVLLTFDTLLPLYAAAVSDERLPVPVGRADERLSDDDFCRQTYLDADWLRRAHGLLQMKRQLILQGVPGTGKTHVARLLARLLARDDAEAVCLAQLHPAYSYEEFVEGIKVKSVEANGRHDVTYPVEDGLLCGFAARAAARPSQPHVLLLDEINRANLPRVFGELLYLLEYRDQEVVLPCSRRRFRLPPNLYLLGTMNGADRSVALVDQALRRRFSFLEMLPDAAVLRAWLRAHPPAAGGDFGDEVVGLFDRLNDRLRADLGPAYQVGHSYFMVPDLDQRRLRDVWTHQVRPLLEEYALLRPGHPLPVDLEELQAGSRRATSRKHHFV